MSQLLSFLRRWTYCKRGIHCRMKYDSGMTSDIGRPGSCSDCGYRTEGIKFPKPPWFKPAKSNDIRKDYIKRLIAGVRRAIETDPDTIKAKEELGDEVTIGKWVDAELLCGVIENEILNNEDI